MSAIGYYKIIGWLKVKDSMGFDAKPPKDLHHGTSRERIRVMFRGYCFKSQDPKLLKIMYYYADKETDVTDDFRCEIEDAMEAKGLNS